MKSLPLFRRETPPRSSMIVIASRTNSVRKGRVREVSTARLGKLLEGDRARDVGNQYKGVLQDFMRFAETIVKDQANEAIGAIPKK